MFSWNGIEACRLSAVRALLVGSLLAAVHLSTAEAQLAMNHNATRMEIVQRMPLWYLNSGASFNLPGRTIMNWHVHGTLASTSDDPCLAVGMFHVSGRIYFAELVLAIPSGPNHVLSARCSDSDPYFAVTRVEYYNYLRLLPRELYDRDVYRTPLPRSCLHQSGMLFFLEVTVKALQPGNCHPTFFRRISPWALVSGPIE